MAFLDTLGELFVGILYNNTSKMERNLNRELRKAGSRYDDMSDSQKQTYHEYQEKLDNLRESNANKREYLNNKKNK